MWTLSRETRVVGRESLNVPKFHRKISDIKSHRSGKSLFCRESLENLKFGRETLGRKYNCPKSAQIFKIALIFEAIFATIQISQQTLACNIVRENLDNTNVVRAGCGVACKVAPVILFPWSHHFMGRSVP